MAKQVQIHLEFNAEWLREQRGRLGWSTTTAAARARAKAREFGDTIKLSQQLVSKLENGGLKSVPRWLGYMQLAMADEIREKDLPEGRLWKVEFPSEIRNYFEEIYFARNHELPGPVREQADVILTARDREDLSLLQSLSDRDRQTVHQLLLSLSGDGAMPADQAQTASATVHSPARSFGGMDLSKGEAA